MIRMKLDDYKNKYYYARKVYGINKPHQSIKYDRPIEVYFEDIMDDGRYSRFLLFDDKEFVTNTLTFPCKIDITDIELIAKDLVDELLSMSDFSDLDKELVGKCACEEYANIYKSCDECPKYNGKDDGCLGVMYSIPSHVNWWEKTETKWENVYGYKSENYKKYKFEIAIHSVKEAFRSCDDDEKYVKILKDELEKILK